MSPRFVTNQPGDKQDVTLIGVQSLRTCGSFFCLQHTDLQLSLAQAEKSYFETQLKLDRLSGEKQVLLQENKSLEVDRDDLRHKLRHITEENVQIKERRVPSIHIQSCS